jgi:hypothetical protein
MQIRRCIYDPENKPNVVTVLATDSEPEFPLTLTNCKEQFLCELGPDKTNDKSAYFFVSHITRVDDKQHVVVTPWSRCAVDLAALKSLHLLIPS